MRFIPLMVLCIALVSSWARAQSIPGEFQEPDDRWMAPNGTIGIAYSGGPSMAIDLNGNGIVGAAAGDPTDPVYTLPIEAQSGLNYFLSPLRDFLYVTRSGSPCGAGVLSMRIYRLPFPVAAPVLIHQDCLPCGAPYNGTPDWYETGLNAHAPFMTGVSPRRIMFIVSRNSQTTCAIPSSSLALRTYDLDVPGPSGRGMAVIADGWQGLRVAQSGNFAFIQHDLSVNPLDVDGSLIDLCPGPNFGQIIHTVNDVSGTLGANLSGIAGGMVTATITLDGAPIHSSVVVDCLAGAAPPLGACCISGVCSQTIQADCTGTWTAAASCNANPCGPPPVPNLVLTTSGPPSVIENQQFAYALTASNTGALAASNVTVSLALPAGSTFVSASNGGFRSGSVVSWSLGTLAAGQSTPLTLTLTAQCNATTISLNTAQITGGHLASWPPPAALVTPVTALSRSPVGITVQSVPSRVPLQPGDTILHTITLSETAGVARSGLTLNNAFINIGTSCTITSVLDAGTGTITLSGNFAFRWTGSLASNQTTQIVILATVSDCISIYTTGTQLGTGNPIDVRNACGFVLGASTPPGPFPLQRPIETTFGISNISPGLVGPPSTDELIYIDTVFQPVRQGATIVLDLVLTNVLSSAEPTVTATLTLPAGLTLANPPFTGPPPAGASWDNASRTLNFAGPLAPGQTLTLSINAILPAAIGCTGSLLMEPTGSTTPRCEDIGASFRIIPVAPVPTGPFDVILDESQGLTVIDESASPINHRTACMPSEIWWGLARGPGREVWLCGLPTLRIDLDSLDFAILPASVQDAVNTVGANYVHIRDADRDPTTGDMILYGRPSNGASAHLFRYNRNTHAVTHLIADIAFNAVRDIVCEPDGSVLVPLGASVRRVSFSGQPLPLPQGSGTTLAFPLPTNDFGGLAGIRTGNVISRLARDSAGLLYASVTSTFRLDEGAPNAQPFVTTQVQSILALNSATVSSTILTDHAAAIAYRTPFGFPAVASTIAPLIVQDFGASAFAPVDGTRFHFGENGFGNFVGEVALSPESFRYIMPVSGFGPGSVDILHFVPIQTCTGDWDGDGDTDSDDIIAFFGDWDTGSGDADGDLDSDSDDIIEFFASWDTGC